MRLELFGAIALATLATAACDSDEETTLGQSTEGTGGAIMGAGGSTTGAGGSSIGNGGSSVGNGGSTVGNGGSNTGNGGSTTGNGGSTTGAGGRTGAGGTAMVTCPTSAPNDGDTCSGRGSCPYDNTTCFCARGMNGGSRSWRCVQIPDGGFPQPGRDGGFNFPDGFTPPAQCTQGSDCTGGDVCCEFQQGGGAALCIASANCTQFGGTPLP